MGNDETVALTAFVVIALHHGLAVFQDGSAQQLKNRVVRKPAPLSSTAPSCPRSGSPAGWAQAFLRFLLGSLHLQG